MGQKQDYLNASTIYIPIWFYSNGQKVFITLEINVFTFQYGSIQMTGFMIASSMDMIYIPIWFYSNKEEDGMCENRKGIYIPIWFYSNVEV